MADARFYTSAGPITAAQLADLTGVSLEGSASLDTYYDDVATLTTASGNHVSFIDNKQYVGAFQGTRAGAVFLTRELVDQSPDGTVHLISSDPYLAYSKAATAFYPNIYAIFFLISKISMTWAKFIFDFRVIFRLLIFIKNN